MVLKHEEAKILRDDYMADPFELIRETEQAVIAKLSKGVDMPVPCIYEGVDSPLYDAPKGYTTEQLQAYGASQRLKALEDAATLIESTELSGLNGDIKLQVLVGKVLIEYCKAVRAMKDIV